MANPNPPDHSENLTAPRFKKGESGNPGGKTKEQKRLEMENAEKAMRLRALALDDMLARIEDGANLSEMVDNNFLRMLKDAEDRGLGAPVQAHTSPDGSMTPKVITLKAEPVPDAGDD